jgi:hypothetical protein
MSARSKRGVRQPGPRPISNQVVEDALIRSCSADPTDATLGAAASREASVACRRCAQATPHGRGIPLRSPTITPLRERDGCCVPGEYTRGDGVVEPFPCHRVDEPSRTTGEQDPARRVAPGMGEQRQVVRAPGVAGCHAARMSSSN